MRRYVYWGISALAVGGVAVAIALFAGPTGKRAVPEGVGSAEAGLIKSCYPDNEFNETPGPAFKSFGSGTARFWESELEHPSYSGGDYVGGKIVWSFSQVMTQASGVSNDPYSGDFGGFLVAKVTWENGQQAKFVSKCLVEVNTQGGSILEASVEAEGWVTGFPEDTSRQSAVAVLKMKREASGRKVQVQFIVTLGTRCNNGSPEKEFTVGANSIEPADPDEGSFLDNLKETGVASGVLKSPDSTAGAHSFPNGFDHSGNFNCPSDFQGQEEAQLEA